MGDRGMTMTWLPTLALLACGQSSLPQQPAAGPPPARGSAPGVDPANPGCLSAEEASNGTTPTPPAHAVSCTLLEFDDVGPVAKSSRTFDGAGRVISERSERLDDPPRTTVHDYTFVPPPRKTLRVVEYDAKGHTTREAVDDGIDAILDDERLWTFDGQGHETSAETRRMAATTRTGKSYDAAGFLTAEESFSNGAFWNSTKWTRRPDGEPLESFTFVGGSATLGSTKTWSYGAGGNLEQDETVGANGKRLELNIYDVARRLVEKQSGWNDKTDLIQQFSFDENGKVLRDHRFEASGKEIEDTVRTYDAKGHMLTLWHWWGYAFAAGPTTDFYEYQVGTCGEIISATYSSGGNAVRTSTFAFDKAGHIISSEETVLSRTATKSRTTATFDGAGHLTRLRWEFLDAGQWKFDYERQRTFDAAGHLVLDETTHASRPGDVTREAWTFDGKGDLVVHESNANYGRHKVREEFGYGCLY